MKTKWKQKEKEKEIEMWMRDAPKSMTMKMKWSMVFGLVYLSLDFFPNLSLLFRHIKLNKCRRNDVIVLDLAYKNTRKIFVVMVYVVCTVHTHTLTHTRTRNSNDKKKKLNDGKAKEFFNGTVLLAFSLRSNRFTWSFFRCVPSALTHEWILVCCILTNTLNDKGARTRVNERASEWLRAFENYPGSRQTSLMSMFFPPSPSYQWLFGCCMCVFVFHFILCYSFALLTAPVRSSADHFNLTVLRHFTVYNLKFSHFVWYLLFDLEFHF